MGPDEKNIEKIINLMLNDDSIDASRRDVKWAKNLSKSWSFNSTPSLIRRIIAVLAQELSGDQPVFGERSASPGLARQMLFTADEYAIDLRLTSLSRGVNIHGQVLGGQCGGAQVKLYNNDFSNETVIDESDEFRLDNVPNGAYTIVINSDKVEIILDDLEIF